MDEKTENPDLVGGNYLFTLERRTLADIRALGGNSPEDNQCFATAARYLEINQGLYRTFLSPAVQMVSTPQTADFLKQVHPNRLQFEAFSDFQSLHDICPCVGGNGKGEAPAMQAGQPTDGGGARHLGLDHCRSRRLDTPARMMVNFDLFQCLRFPLLQSLVGLARTIHQ